MAAHRYWRLNITAANGGTLLRIAEIEFSEVSGAPAASIGAGGTAAASSLFGGFVASDAFEQNVGTSWASASGVTAATISYDWGSGVTKDIHEVALSVFGSDVDRMPTAFTVQYSDDNSAWTTEWTVSGATGWATSERRVFTDPTTSNFGSNTQAWRVNVTAIDGAGTLSFADLQWRTSPGGADQSSGGTPFSSRAVDFSHQADKLYDTNGTTYWGTTTGTVTGTPGYKFSSAKTIQEITITARTGSQTATPKTFTVQYWDGSAWQTKWTVASSSGWSSGETRTFTDPSPGFGSAASTSDFFLFI